MVLICKMWAPIAMEYTRFLNRYGLDTIAVLCKTTISNLGMAVFADEDKYLKLSLEDVKFSNEEKQIMMFLNIIERLSTLVLELLDEVEFLSEYDDENDDEYEYLEDVCDDDEYLEDF